ncbi:MAG TPA: hypothetical protein VK738_06680 [Terriglobales bacterium]|jgi:hypothetical protein|nr:hypothetical protein [Terriglobales bacterium]
MQHEIKNNHLQIVVAEGKVTLEDLHAALDHAIRHVVKGGCNCGLTGFDISFLRGDPELTPLAELNKVPHIQGGILTR